MKTKLFLLLTSLTSLFLVYSCDSPTDVTDKSKTVKVSEILKTEYFDVIVNSVKITHKVNTGNEFTDVTADQGTKFIVLNVTFKNTSSETRTLFVSGPLLINNNGKTIQCDHDETIMLEGWGILVDEINPMVSKSTNLVYKISNDTFGAAYWQPDRSSDNERIYLGKILSN